MKRIFLKLIFISILSVCTLAVYNYIVDPYGIVHNSSLDLGFEPGYEPNQHYARMRHLVNDEVSWDSYLFGSSRVGKINPDLIPDGNYYNMNYSEGVPGEHLDDIKIMLQKGLPVKNVMIGLDNTSYLINPEDHMGQDLRHPYDASFFRRIFFQIKYLCFAPRISIGRYMRFKKNDPVITFGILGNGMQNLEKIDAKIESNIERHINDKRFRKANIIPFDKASEHKYMKLMDYAIRDIAEIVELSEKHNFNVYFFVNPTHVKYYLQGNPYHFLIFKQKLAEVTGYWDFSGLNSITTNNYNYYETSHYRAMIGDLIICRMTNCSNISVPEDFGGYVTRENVNYHIKKQKDRLLEML